MNRFIYGLIFSVIFLLGQSSVYSQREKGASLITVGVGLSAEAVAISQANSEEDVEASGTPTFSLMYDYGITPNFSIGAAIGYNSLSITDESTSFVDQNGVIRVNTISGTASRTNIALRPLYHWGKKEDLEWFTGVRMGYSMWKQTITATDPYYNDQEFNQNSGYSFQLLFGSRAYINENLALMFDLGIGAPYFVNLGISMKL